MCQQPCTQSFAGNHWERTTHIDIGFYIAVFQTQFFKAVERFDIFSQKLRNWFLKSVIYRQQIVALAWTIELTTLHSDKRRKSFVELTNMFSVRFTENPIGKALKRSKV